MHVLLVDDERLALGIMAGGLRNRGITVTVASSGHEALELWNPDSFDVLLTDIAMPGMTGLELAQKISAINDQASQNCAAQLIALTGNYADRIEDRTFGLTFDLVLCKPITVAAVAKQLKDRGGRRRRG